MSDFKFWIKKNSPTILLVTGIVALVGDIVVTAYRSTKVNATLKPHRERIQYLKNEKNRTDAINAGEVNVVAINSDIRKEYGLITLDLMKLYWPTVALTSLSMTLFLYSNNILARREAAAAAALSASQAAFTSYRELMQQKLGEVEEKKVYIEAEDIKDDEEDNTTALEVTNKTYDFIYDTGDKWWETNTMENLMTIYGIERNLNRKLRAEGCLFLIDVYKEFELNASKLNKWQLKAAHVVGWLYDEPNGIKDYVSFGVHIPESGGALTEYGLSIKDSDNPTILIELHPRGDILTGRDNQPTFIDTVRECGI